MNCGKVSIYLLLLIAILTASCASDKKNRVLDDSLKLYSSAIRWGDFQGATRFYKEPSLVSHIDFTKLKSVKVTGYDLTGGMLSQDGNQLRQTVRIRFYDTGIGREKEINDNQIWEYDDERQLWMLITPMPELY